MEGHHKGVHEATKIGRIIDDLHSLVHTSAASKGAAQTLRLTCGESHSSRNNRTDPSIKALSLGRAMTGPICIADANRFSPHYIAKKELALRSNLLLDVPNRQELRERT